VAEHRANVEVGGLLQTIPFRDSQLPSGEQFWEETSVHTYIEAINASGIAIYLQGGWDDHMRRETIVSYLNLTTPRKLLMGPWRHCVLAGFDYAAEIRRFFDYWLKGIQNGVMDQPPITYFEGNSSGGVWRTEWHWSAAGEGYQPLYLQGGASRQALPNEGILGRDVPWQLDAADAFNVVKNIISYRVAVGVARPAVDPAYRDARGLTYTTETLEAPLTILGNPVARIWVASSNDDADVFAYLSEIMPDGRIVNLSEGRLRGSHRKPSPPPYRLDGLPFHSGRAADVEPMTPGTATLLEFELLPMAYVVKSGHRLRLTITGDNATGAGMPPDTRPADRLTVFRDTAHPSHLDLPVRR
jgi:putative CocE/NonD family hydrolase